MGKRKGWKRRREWRERRKGREEGRGEEKGRGGRGRRKGEEKGRGGRGERKGWKRRREWRERRKGREEGIEEWRESRQELKQFIMSTKRCVRIFDNHKGIYMYTCTVHAHARAMLYTALQYTITHSISNG